MIQPPMPKRVRQYMTDHFITSTVAVLCLGSFATGILFGNVMDGITYGILRSPWWFLMGALSLGAIVFLFFCFRRVAEWLYPILKALDSVWQEVETNKDKKEQQSEQPAN
jgi:Na+/melibiose symporter-like transporter